MDYVQLVLGHITTTALIPFQHKYLITARRPSIGRRLLVVIVTDIRSVERK